jgi:signal transduction histidine kinase
LGAALHGSTIVVSVTDDGAGIPVEVQPRIFDPFFTTKPVGEGVGLGLDIVRRAVSDFGGDVEFDSVPGRTEFRVRLPAMI